MFAPRVKTMQGTSLVLFRDNRIWNVYEYSEDNLLSLENEILADLSEVADINKVEVAEKDYEFSNCVFRTYLKGHEFDRAGEYYRIQRY